MKNKVIKKLVIILSVLILIAGAITVLALTLIKEPKPSEIPPVEIEVTVSYRIDSKYGKIVGDSEQKIKIGEDATPVTIVPNLGYKFVGWSDTRKTTEEANLTREDKNVTDYIFAEALFEGPINLPCNFKAGKGGTIQGPSTQSIPYNGDGETVTAVPDKNFRFAKWSDGETNPVRELKNVTKAVNSAYEAFYVTAIFEKYQLECTYNYNDATANNTAKTVLFKVNEIEDTVLVVPQRENCVFEGWYSDWHLTTQVSDETGKVLVDNDWLLNDEKYDEDRFNPEGQLYAKWKAVTPIPVYKILMVFVTEVHGDFLAGSYNKPETLKEIRVDYVMSDTERKICEQTAEYFERFLNAISNAEVDFVIDTYFTTQPKSEKNFNRGTDHNLYGNYAIGDLFERQFPEIKDKTNGYGSVLTTFSLCGVKNDFALTGNTAGAAFNKFGYVVFDGLLHTYANSGDYKLEDRLDLNISSSYSTLYHQLSTYMHEFIHTIEAEAAILHVVASEYANNRDSKIYDEYECMIDILRGKCEWEGINVVPKEFWIENDFSQKNKFIWRI